MAQPDVRVLPATHSPVQPGTFGHIPSAEQISVWEPQKGHTIMRIWPGVQGGGGVRSGGSVARSFFGPVALVMSESGISAVITSASDMSASAMSPCGDD